MTQGKHNGNMKKKKKKKMATRPCILKQILSTPFSTNQVFIVPPHWHPSFKEKEDTSGFPLKTNSKDGRQQCQLETVVRIQSYQHNNKI